MEKSLNSTSESTVSDNSGKSVFSKPKDFYQAFEVSMEDSLRASQNNKSDLDSDMTSSRANKALPFRKSRKSVQHSFSVSSGESLVNESEQSVTFAKPQGLFAKQSKSLVDFFNVSFNETNAAATVENGSDETLENNNVTAGEKEMNDSTEVTVFETKTDPFKQKKLETECSMMSLTEQRSTRSKASFCLLGEQSQTPKNISINKSMSELTGNTACLEQSSINDDNLNNWMSDQSDEEMPPPRIPSLNANLSGIKERQVVSDSSVQDDHSDEKMPPPRIPSLNANLSGIKEKQVVSDSPVNDVNPKSVWEQKLNDIVTNAAKKSLGLKQKVTLDSPKRPDTSKKKSKANNENAGCTNENIEVKFRPPKLLRPASFVSKQLYAFLKRKLEPKYGIDTVIESENMVALICDTVKKVTRRKTYQKRLVQRLKKEMAEAGLIETTMDFYEFIIKYLPYSFRVKVVPCLQPVTNMVYPPKDIANPFDKVL